MSSNSNDTTHDAEFNPEDVDRDAAFFTLRGLLDELKESEFNDLEIYNLLQVKSKDLPYKLTDAEWEDLTRNLDPRTDEQKAAAEKSYRRKLLEDAIASKDRNRLLTEENIHTLADLKLNAPLVYDLKFQDIHDAFGKKLDYSRLNSHIAAEAKKIEAAEKESGAEQKPDVATIAQLWAMDHHDTWAYDENRQVWRHFTGEYWREEEDKSSFLDQYAVGALQDAGVKVNSSTPLNLFQRIAASHCKRDFTQAAGKINFKNGTLDVETQELLPFFDKDDNFTYCLPYLYEPYGKHPNIDKLLYDAFPDDFARCAFMAHGGLALMRDVLVHQFLGMIGATRAGKSTLLALLNALCGAMEPYEFAGASIFSRELEGKRARFKWADNRIVTVDEMPAEALRDEENLKSMTGHGGVEMRGIGKDEQKKNRWVPKLTFTSNDQPAYKDNSGAVKERAVFIEINKAKPKEERDPKLFVEKLLPELGAFAASCIELGMQARDKGFYPQSVAMKMLLDRIACESNPLKHWIMEHMVLGPENKGYKVETDKAFGAYIAFCQENGHSQAAKTTKVTFSKEMRMMNIGVEPKMIRVTSINGSTNVRGLAGIRFRHDDDPKGGETAYTDDAPLVKSARISPPPVNSTDSTVNNSVNTVKQPVEPNKDGLLTVLTEENSNIPQRENTHSLYPASQTATQESECVSFSESNVVPNEPLTPLTSGTNGHIEPDETLTELLTVESQPLTPVPSGLFGEMQPLEETSIDARIAAILAKLKVGRMVNGPDSWGTVTRVTDYSVTLEHFGKQKNYTGVSILGIRL